MAQRHSQFVDRRDSKSPLFRSRCLAADHRQAAFTINATQPATLQLLSIINSNGVVSLTWNSVSGTVYRVQYTPELGIDTWSNLVPDVQATGTTASTSDDTGGAGQRFYRVLQLP